MAKNPLVIELGERSIRVCQPKRVTQKKNSKLGLGLMMEFPMPGAVVEDGFIVNPLELGAYIKGKLRDEHVKFKDTIFVLNSAKIVIREVEVPQVEKKKQRAVSEATVNDSFPIDVSTYRLGYAEMGLTEATEGEQPKLRLSAVAVPSAIIDGYVSMADTAGLRIQAFDYAGNSEYQFYKELNALHVTLYAYIDHNSARMTFMRGADVLLQRGLSFGGGEIVEDYVSWAAKRGDDAYAESVVELSRRATSVEYMTEEKAAAVYSRLAVGIERTLRFFNSKYGGNTVNSVVLTGPLAKLFRLNEVVSAELALSTITLEEQSEAMEHLSDMQQAMAYLTDIGATIAPIGFMQGTKGGKAKISLKQPLQLQPQQQLRSYTIFGGIIVLSLSVVAAAAICLSAYLELVNTKQESVDLQAHIDNMVYAEDIHNDYILYRSSANQSQNLLISTNSRNDELKALFEEMQAKMPSEILVLSMSCTKDGLSMNITVPTKADVARVIVQFRTFESLSTLHVPAVSDTTEGEGGYVSFSLTYVYNVPPLDLVPVDPSDDPHASADVEQDLEDYENKGGVQK